MRFRPLVLLLPVAVALFAAGRAGSGLEVENGVARVAARTAVAQPKYERLRDRVVGYSLRYPRRWEVVRQPVVATEFGAGARCRSVQIVDFAPPPESGGGLTLRSFVQVCARRRTDGWSLGKFMRRTYDAAAFDAFARTKLAGVRAYRDRGADQDLTYLQTAAYRLQIQAVVVADGARQDRRLRQVLRVVRSFSLRMR
jgi:hypothetical protein